MMTNYKSSTTSCVAVLGLLMAISMSFSFNPLAVASAKETCTAAYYVPDNSSACQNGVKGAGEMVAMVPEKDFKKGAVCGDKYKVTCTGGTNGYPSPCKRGKWVTVTVANSCAGDDCATFTLSTAAFDVIAKREAGRVTISYKRVK